MRRLLMAKENEIQDHRESAGRVSGQTVRSNVPYSFLDSLVSCAHDHTRRKQLCGRLRLVFVMGVNHPQSAVKRRPLAQGLCLGGERVSEGILSSEVRR